MDPLSALGLAGNVAQLVDFSCKLFKSARTVYKSASGSSTENALLHTIAEDLTRMMGNIIVSPEHHSPELRRLAEEAQKISRELLDVLEKLRLRGEKTKWKSFVVALNEAWSRNELKQTSERLFALQAQLNTHIQLTVSLEVSNLSKKMKSIERKDATLDLGMHDSIGSAKQSEGALRSLAPPSGHSSTETESQIPQSDATPVPAAACPAEDNALWWRVAGEQLEQLSAKVSRLQQDQETLASLRFDSMTARVDSITEAHASTFSWIFTPFTPDWRERIPYIRWLIFSQTGTFWIRGKAGSGKSTLMKFISSHPQTCRSLKTWANDRRLVVASFFFWNSGTALEKSQIGMLRSLLFEMLKQCPELLPHLRSARAQFHSRARSGIHLVRDADIAREEEPDLEPSRPWTHEELLWVYQQILQDKVSAKFCFFIDGLDEYKAEGTRDHRDLIKTLQLLSKLPNVKLCLSSRPWTIFADAFGTDNLRSLQLEHFMEKDIRRYVSDKFTEHDQYQKMVDTNSEYSDLIDKVVTRAKGVFLWVFLVVRDLLEGLTYNDTIKAMHLRLAQFPPDLESYFQRMIDSIPQFYRHDTVRTFRLALTFNGAMPLLFYGFMDDIVEDDKFDLGAALEAVPKSIAALAAKQETIRRRLEGRSKGLLEMFKMDDAGSMRPYVSFLHRTVRDYFEKSGGFQSLISEDSGPSDRFWFQACQASLLTLKSHLISRNLGDRNLIPCFDEIIPWSMMFHFGTLAIDESSVRPMAVISILELAELESAWPEGRDITALLKIAAKGGLPSYIRYKIDRLPSKADRFFMAMKILYEAMTPQPYSPKRGLDPDLIAYLLSTDTGDKLPECETFTLPFADVEQRPIPMPGGPKIGIVAHICLLLDHLYTGKISAKQKGVLEVAKLLLSRRGEVNLELDPPIVSMLKRRFSPGQVSWLLDQDTTEDGQAGSAKQDLTPDMREDLPIPRD